MFYVIIQDFSIELYDQATFMICTAKLTKNVLLINIIKCQ